MHRADSRTLVTRRVGHFDYTRHEYDSAALHTPNTFGILRPAGSVGLRGALYFLHGGDGTDEQWLQAGLESCLGAQLVEWLTTRGISIVLPNIGLSFLRAPDDPLAPSHFGALFGELMPMVEGDTPLPPSSRWISGISMGGCAALSAYLRRPSQFAGCAALFPGLVDFDPFDDHALAAYGVRTGIDATHRGVLAHCFRSAFDSPAEWQRHDPVALVGGIDTATARELHIHLEVGSADEFGLQAGVQAFSERCASRGITTSAAIIGGGHHDAALLQQRIDPLLASLVLTAPSRPTSTPGSAPPAAARRS